MGLGKSFTVDPTDKMEAFRLTLSALVSAGGDGGRAGAAVLDDVSTGFEVPDEGVAEAPTMVDVPCRSS